MIVHSLHEWLEFETRQCQFDGTVKSSSAARWWQFQNPFSKSSLRDNLIGEGFPIYVTHYNFLIKVLALPVKMVLAML